MRAERRVHVRRVDAQEREPAAASEAVPGLAPAQEFVDVITEDVPARTRDYLPPAFVAQILEECPLKKVAFGLQVPEAEVKRWLAEGVDREDAVRLTNLWLVPEPPRAVALVGREEVAAAVKAAGSVTKLAALLGVSRMTVHRYLNGTSSPKLATSAAVWEILGARS